MEEKRSLIQGFEKLDIVLSAKQLNQFHIYYEYLIEKNKVMNLTAITEYEEVVKKHFIDSASLILCREFKGKGSLIDVGTGAGFPGIPLKIVFPDLNVTLLDSLNKRVNFLNEVIERLELTGISAIHDRAEDAARKPEYRERFDYAVSRAVSNLSTLSEYCMPFVKKGGFFIPYKSGKIEEELNSAKNAVTLLSGSIQEVVSFHLPDSEIERALVVIKKEDKIAHKYPRKAGTPAKEPLS